MVPRRLAAEMRWTFQPAAETFSRYRSFWDEINRANGNHILLDSAFVGPLLSHFGSKRILLGLLDRDHGRGAALLRHVRAGAWETFTPSQCPLGLIVLEDDIEAVEQSHALLKSLPGYPLSFSVLQQDPLATAFTDADCVGLAEKMEYIETPWLAVKGRFADYWQTRNRNFARNLARQERRLAEKGITLALQTIRAPGLVSDCIARYGAMESNGWKGREGSAVSATNAQGLFYRELLEGFCERQEGVVYELTANGKTIASDLCLERNGSLMILKTAYDESLNGISPGLLLHKLILQSLFAEGRIHTVEFCGRMVEWNRKWTNEARRLYHVNVFRHRWVLRAREAVRTVARLWSGIPMGIGSFGKRPDGRPAAMEDRVA
ncbi:hypothetical protein NITMOv2_0343 [Nitrospira moscoviensis]|uniref:BioF2-like acetyltransferase domain-containing protein n=2 Tax=Nitrospira moscoviensis TaxID=42253 RepID=A0A0K2G728_NITMO|nr:hypothetical protein NITMOv2_0343 [Nitrospira moscoviensis]